MGSAADLLDVDYAVELLVRLLAIDGVAGEEAAIAAALRPCTTARAAPC